MDQDLLLDVEFLFEEGQDGVFVGGSTGGDGQVFNRIGGDRDKRFGNGSGLGLTKTEGLATG